MSALGDNRFALCVATVIADSKVGAQDDLSQAIIAALFHSWVRCQHVPLVNPVSAEFEECWKAMIKLQLGPGVLWLRDIFYLQDGHECHELKKEAPDGIEGGDWKGKHFGRWPRLLRTGIRSAVLLVAGQQEELLCSNAWRGQAHLKLAKSSHFKEDHDSEHSVWLLPTNYFAQWKRWRSA